MELNVVVPGDTAKQKTIQVSDDLFGREFSESLIHQVVTAYLAGARAGTHAQKNRSAVSGGGKKPWRQKGTGRARAGTTRSPIWRSGGVTFAAKPADYSQKVNKKMYHAAMQSIFSELIRKNRLIVVDSFKINEPKTKLFNEKIKLLNVENVLIINDTVDENLFLSSRNIINVDVRDVQGIDPVCLVRHENIVITEAALKELEEWL